MKLKILLTTSTIILFSGIALSQNYYLGVGSPSDPQNTSCASCHAAGGIATDVYSEWINTRHAVAQDSVSSSFYGYNCLQCHNTGWDLATANYGADEYVVLDTNQTPDYVVTDVAKWNKVKNVGCESCHGPMGNAQGTTTGVDEHWQLFTLNNPDYSADNCGVCHQQEHHPYL